jgi:phosphatidylglycerophosphate synthase
VTTSATEGWQLRLCFLAAATCIQLRLIANLLDGMVAVEGGKGGPTGDLWNEAPDRVADVMILIGAGYAAGSSPMLGMIAALVAVFVAYVRALGASVGAGQIFLGPMAKPHRMFLMTLMCLLAVLIPPRTPTGDAASTPLFQFEVNGTYYYLFMPSVDGFDFQLGFMSFALLVIIIGGAITSGRRLRRIAEFLREKASV